MKPGLIKRLALPVAGVKYRGKNEPSEFEQAAGPEFELFVEAFDVDEPSSEMVTYLPVHPSDNH